MADPGKDIRNGSRSFALAGLFLSPGQRSSAFRLYAWCRYADDQVDEAASEEERTARLARLGHGLACLHEGQPYPWNALHQAVRGHSIPLDYARDLLAGFALDREGLRIRDGRELDRYAYAVAGTVGLMMCHILGVTRPDALAQAEALGRAMQLTNIARDVREDLARGRIYVPRDMLEAEGVRGDRLLSPENIGATKRAVDSLLLVAEDLYRHGERGLGALPLRAALAISAALELYREIGRRLLGSGPEALLSRSVVPPWKKALLCARAFFRVARSVPERLLLRQSPLPQLPLWRPSP